MVAALLALGGAVVTAAAYVWLTERMDYATVNRRQLDAWVAISALAFLVAIVYGGAEMRQAALARAVDARRAPAPARPREIQRIHQPALDLAAPAVRQAEVPAPLRPASAPVVPEPAAGDPPPVLVESSAPSPDRPRWLPEQVDMPPPLVAPLPERAESVLVPATPTVVLRRGLPAVRSLPTSPAAPPPIAPVSRAAFVTAVPPTATQAPSPTPLPPTPEPTDEPLPTPHCGDPNRIDTRIEITDAEAIRRGQPQSVRYAARIENRTDFPLTLTELVATAQDSRSGSDQFGSDRQSDLTIPPGHSAEVAGTISLEKLPSPFGRSELCISFVAETCGQRSSQRPVTRRCDGISGF